MCVEKKPITFHNGVEGITGPEEMRSYSTHIVHHVMIKNGLKWRQLCSQKNKRHMK